MSNKLLGSMNYMECIRRELKRLRKRPALVPYESVRYYNRKRRAEEIVQCVADQYINRETYNVDMETVFARHRCDIGGLGLKIRLYDWYYNNEEDEEVIGYVDIGMIDMCPTEYPRPLVLFNREDEIIQYAVDLFEEWAMSAEKKKLNPRIFLGKEVKA